ncbi:MAG: dodecin domain-containing protein [Thermoproteales archaeon]|nr:dodecin domain-containing protein [Thermoproteales archaeon]
MTVVKIIELIGSSNISWEDAAKNALKEARKTVRNIVGMDVLKFSAKIKDGEIIEYRANVKIAFIVERP